MAQKKSSDQKLLKQQEEEVQWYNKMEQDRREGRALLRRMVIKSDDEDWKAVIDQADSLKKKKDKIIKKQEKRWRRQTKKQRKKYDATGSFSVNLLTMKQSMETDCATAAEPSNSKMENNSCGKMEVDISKNSNKGNGAAGAGVHRWRQSVVPVTRHRSDATATSFAEDDYDVTEEEEAITVKHALPTSSTPRAAAFVEV